MQIARAASVRKRARSSVASSRSPCSISAIWCRIWKAWVAAAAWADSVSRRAAGSKRRSGASASTRERDAVPGLEPGGQRRAPARRARARRRNARRRGRSRRCSCRSSGRSRAPPPRAAAPSAPSSRPSASLSCASRSWLSRCARCSVRKARARFGALEATSWMSPSGGAAPKTGSASASRMSATMRSVEPAAELGDVDAELLRQRQHHPRRDRAVVVLHLVEIGERDAELAGVVGLGQPQAGRGSRAASRRHRACGWRS